MDDVRRIEAMRGCSGCGRAYPVRHEDYVRGTFSDGLCPDCRDGPPEAPHATESSAMGAHDTLGGQTGRRPARRYGGDT